MNPKDKSGFPMGIPLGKPGAMEVLDLNEELPSHLFHHSARSASLRERGIFFHGFIARGVFRLSRTGGLGLLNEEHTASAEPPASP